MLIGILSDIHDHLQNLNKALEAFKHRGIRVLIFCGDFCSPIPARVLGNYDGEVHCVFGNGDGDRFQIARLAHADYPNLKLHGEYAELEFEGVNLAVTHYPFYAQALAGSGKYRAVFSGHTHEQSEARLGDCLWLNPGEVMGWKGRATCAVYDPKKNTAEIIELEN
ncbi:MAG: metallophosphoesterase [candidate division KSB1 bacterium]|nr:metallophosphoesterase [candidate division KSB1 bacterium]